MKLRELQPLAAANLVILGLTVESANIRVSAMTAQSRVGAVHLHVAVPLVARRQIHSQRVGVETSLAKPQIKASADVARGLRIAVETAVQTDSLKVATLDIRCHRVHFVGAGVENLHTVDGCRKALGGHIVHHRFPRVRAAPHHCHIAQIANVLVDACRLPLHRPLSAPRRGGNDNHLVHSQFASDGCIGLGSQNSR